ncbi:hypothetical protein ACVIHB_000841 [Bradyrhizobium liaoningense]
MVERDDLAVDHRVGQRSRFLGNGGELAGPVETLARLQRRLAVLDPELHPVAVELDLVAPALVGRRPLHQRTELRRDEIRHLRDLPCVRRSRGALLRRSAALQRGARRRLDRAPFRLLGTVGLPDCIGLAPGTLGQHERLWRAALAFGNLLHRAAGGDGLVLVENVVVRAFADIFVTMLDQEPVGALAAGAVVAHAHQDPASMQLLAVQGELQIALLEAGFRIIRFPRAAVPQHHRAAAILPFRNRAFEIAIVERMVFHLDRQPLVVRIEGGSFRHRPGLEHAVEFEPEIVVQAAGVVLLDHEAPLLRWRDCGFARWLRRLSEIPLLSVSGEFLQHDRSRFSFGI